MSIEGTTCDKCEEGKYIWNNFCGALVCDNENCRDHHGLGKCFCGWNLHNGEILEDDVETG